MASSDRKLAQQVLAGDARAAEELARRCHADLYQFLMWRTHDADLAASLTQDAFVRAWEHLAQFRGESSLRTWTYRIAFSVLTDYHRHESREQRAVAAYTQQPQTTEREHLQRAELRAALAEALAQLPESECNAIILCKLRGFTLAEAAGLLGEPVGTVAWRIAAGAQMLRGLLSGELVRATPAPPLAKEASPDVSSRS